MDSGYNKHIEEHAISSYKQIGGWHRDVALNLLREIIVEFDKCVPNILFKGDDAIVQLAQAQSSRFSRIENDIKNVYEKMDSTPSVTLDKWNQSVQNRLDKVSKLLDKEPTEALNLLQQLEADALDESTHNHVHFSYHTTRGQALLNNGKVSEAVTQLTLAIRADPNNKKATYLMAAIAAINNESNAYELALQALDDADYRDELVANIVLITIRHEESLETAQTFVKNHPWVLNSACCLNSLAQLYLENNETDEAIRLSRQCLEEEPEHSYYKYCLGIALLSKSISPSKGYMEEPESGENIDHLYEALKLFDAVTARESYFTLLICKGTAPQ